VYKRQVVAPGVDAVTAPIDLAMLARLAGVVEVATVAFEEFDYARALELSLIHI